MDLDRLTLPQLKQLSSRIAKEVEKRRSASKTAVLRKLQQLAREHGLTLDEILQSDMAAAARKSTAKLVTAIKSPVPAKYRHPNNRTLAWSGRGRKPHWVDAWLANGGSLDALAVAAEKLAQKQPPATRTPRSTGQAIDAAVTVAPDSAASVAAVE